MPQQGRAECVGLASLSNHAPNSNKSNGLTFTVFNRLLGSHLVVTLLDGAE